MREHRDAWRIRDRALEIHVQPDPSKSEIDIPVTIGNRPPGQYEQANLVRYYDDSHVHCARFSNFRIARLDR